MGCTALEIESDFAQSHDARMHSFPSQDAPNVCRRRCRRRCRCQRATCGHRGRASDPLYKSRRSHRTGAGIRTERQHKRLEDSFTAGTQGKIPRPALVGSLGACVHTVLRKFRKPRRPVKPRAVDVIAYFDGPEPSRADRSSAMPMLVFCRSRRGVACQGLVASGSCRHSLSVWTCPFHWENGAGHG